MKKVVVATRKSELALAQCRQFLRRLAELHPSLSIEENHVVTSGDRILDRPLAEIGGKGLFLKEIEEALLAGEADFAVHSLKDVPPELPAGLRIACVPRREDPRDVLVSRSGGSLAELPVGARLGTSSLRRGLQLKLARPDLEIVPIRGNVGTRIRKCLEGEVEATVLARAGLNRLASESAAFGAARFHDLAPEISLPAVGQGALGIEIREGDEEIAALLAPLEDPTTALAVAIERGVMRAVDGDCKTPVAAFAELEGGEVRVRALLALPDGTDLVRADERLALPRDAIAAHELGLRVGRELRARQATGKISS